MFTLSMYAVECFNSSKEWIDFVLRFSQICFRTNSYADPNQLYNTNVNSNMHPLVHTELGLVQYVSFQNPQYYFCSCLQKQHKRHVLYQLKTMDLGLFLQAGRNRWAKQIQFPQTQTLLRFFGNTPKNLEWFPKNWKLLKVDRKSGTGTPY